MTLVYTGDHWWLDVKILNSDSINSNHQATNDTGMNAFCFPLDMVVMDDIPPRSPQVPWLEPLGPTMMGPRLLQISHGLRWMVLNWTVGTPRFFGGGLVATCGNIMFWNIVKPCEILSAVGWFMLICCWWLLYVAVIVLTCLDKLGPWHFPVPIFCRGMLQLSTQNNPDIPRSTPYSFRLPLASTDHSRPNKFILW